MESYKSFVDDLSLVLLEVSGFLVGGGGMGACLALPGRKEGVLVRSEKEGAYCPGDVSVLVPQCPGAWQPEVCHLYPLSRGCGCSSPPVSWSLAAEVCHLPLGNN